MQAIQAVLFGRHPLHAAPHAVWSCCVQGRPHTSTDSNAPVRARLAAVLGWEDAGKPVSSFSFLSQVQGSTMWMLPESVRGGGLWAVLQVSARRVPSRICRLLTAA